ncbi:precorrin-6y C5,15-methyltransferase (decarboxylating) subunit CbiE [Clostridium omnivorum]|uniref:Precorrin-6y C5,15-methyltransferase (Decarboxylating) subunit CbiE n=1 Tax=Clostridium omnivorum TaxID=1604902 RepID=A0ABQ5NB25_9CLOT|nr:precorrin-6y C5,15-methyltransferase (decarboxylating) subunit CbiE [Clostridium sp. E14]GLC32474.1 precorrin-6y C5,15-methyltransferase (decarboxylating) subunit CbiE [Clostridium sp. E14]
MVYIVGLGPGSKEYILPKALSTLEKSKVIIGFVRAIESLNFIEGRKLSVSTLKDILNYINSYENEDIAIVASGDPCFYGVTEYIKRNYNRDIEVIPGISSFQYLAARLNKCWQGSYLGSLHGREEEFVEKVKENTLSIWLTDKKNSPSLMCRKLLVEKIEAKVYVGENLSYGDEKITEGTAEEIVNMNFSELSVVIIENLWKSK